MGWVLVMVVIYLSLTPVPLDIPVAESDKAGHVIAYAALMLWFSQLYCELPRRSFLALTLVALGIALEFAQRETGYRTFEIADMLADSIGVAAGWLVAPPRTLNVLTWLDKASRRSSWGNGGM